MDINYIPRKISLKNHEDVESVRTFLEGFDLSYDSEDVEYTLALLHNDEVYATGSIKGEVLRNIAVRTDEQGQGLSSKLISLLLQEQNNRNRHHYFVYTKPNNTMIFKSMGFKEIARVEPTVVLLEGGMGSIEGYCKKIGKLLADKPAEKRAGLVMNCNPFTLGHKSLIKRASEENEGVVVFVVHEDMSVFPFKNRFEMVKKGVEEFHNVTVIDGGEYIISNATFPTYFTHGKEAVEAQARLDVTIFSSHIAKAAGIDKRYVGEEPYCQVTNAYNDAMKEILPKYDIELEVISRTRNDDEVISASKVRKAIRDDDWDRVRSLVPETTYEAVISDELKSVVEKIKNTETRH